MPDVNEQINIIATFTSKLSGMNKAINTLDKLKNAQMLTNKEYDESISLLEKSDPQMFKVANQMKKYEEKQKKVNAAQKAGFLGSKKYTGALLGLMFTSMAVSRVFGGMVRSVLDILGVSEMWNATILTVLMPALQPLADILFNIMDWFMNLSDGWKLAIGIIVLVVFALATIVTWLSIIIIAISAVVTAFAMPGVISVIGTIISVIGTIAVVFAGVVLIITGIIDIFKGKLEGIGLVIMGIGTIILLFAFWWGLIIIAVGLCVYWVIKHWDTVKGWFSSFFSWLGNMFSAIWDGIKSGFKAVVNFFIWGLNTWIGGWEAMFNFAIKGLNFLINLINKIPGINIGTIGNVSFGIIPSFANGGVMPYTGLAMVHKGETVTPAGQNINSSPIINISANVSNDYDVRRLADQLSKFWTSDFERISKGRGMI
jgi:hypothetical protein